MFVLHETYNAVQNSNDPITAILLGASLVIIVAVAVWAWRHK